MNPKGQIAAFTDAEEDGLEITAVYHSHPAGPEIPSPTDIAQATYPELIYLIASLKNVAQPTLRGFYIIAQTVHEVELLIV